MAKLPGTRLGAFRAYFFGFFICTSGFLFGYDTGIVGKCRSHDPLPIKVTARPDFDICHRWRPHPQIVPK